jgi:hypothetical protein
MSSDRRRCEPDHLPRASQPCSPRLPQPRRHLGEYIRTLFVETGRGAEGPFRPSSVSPARKIPFPGRLRPARRPQRLPGLLHRLLERQDPVSSRLDHALGDLGRVFRPLAVGAGGQVAVEAGTAAMGRSGPATPGEREVGTLNRAQEGGNDGGQGRRDLRRGRSVATTTSVSRPRRRRGPGPVGRGSGVAKSPSTHRPRGGRGARSGDFPGTADGRLRRRWGRRHVKKDGAADNRSRCMEPEEEGRGRHPDRH